MNKPEVIFCPNCKKFSTDRKYGKCRHCETELYYGGEYIPSDSKGYIWFKKTGWIKVKDWLNKLKSK